MLATMIISTTFITTKLPLLPCASAEQNWESSVCVSEYFRTGIQPVFSHLSLLFYMCFVL